MSTPASTSRASTGALKPAVVVTAADLDKAGTRVPEFYAGDLFCPVGKTPLYLGQPVALLIFETFDAFDQARLALRDGTLREVRRGDRPGRAAELRRLPLHPRRRPDARRARRLFAAPGRLGQPGQLPEHRRCRSGRRSPRRREPAYAKAATYGEQIRAELAANDPGLLVLDREFETQSVDPMFLEPECGLAWYDKTGQQARARARRAVALRGGRVGRIPARQGAAAVQAGAHQRAVRLCRRRLRRARPHAVPALRRARRDVLPRPAGAARARPLSAVPGRHQAARLQDAARGSASTARPARSRAFAADHVLDGGGLANFSPNVATVGATAAIGIYDVPKVDVTTVALHTRGVTAGSMRGYGTLQTMTALEVLIDEAAAALPLDPIEFRRRNALKPGGRTMTGNPYTVSVRTAEILDKLEKHPIWRDRAAGEGARAGRHAGRHRRRLRHQGLRHRRRLLARPRRDRPGRPHLDPLRSRRDGQRHRHRARQPRRAASRRRRRRGHGRADRRLRRARARHLGRSATRWTRRRRTPRRRIRAGCRRSAPPTSASIGAHVGTHAAAEAARVIFRFGLWPAALELWRIARERSARQGVREGALEGRPAHHRRAARRCRCRRSPRPRMRATSSPAR